MNAISDGEVHLANVYYELKTKGYSEAVYQNILKKRDEQSTYKKARRITSEDIPAAPVDVQAAKEIVTTYLKEMKSSCNPFVIRAIIDDLDMLIREEESESYIS